MIITTQLFGIKNNILSNLIGRPGRDSMTPNHCKENFVKDNILMNLVLIWISFVIYMNIEHILGYQIIVIKGRI